MLRRLVLFCCVPALSACATREVAPVAMSQPGDAELGCADIEQQLKANHQAETELAGEDKQVAQTNVAKGVGSVVPGVGILLAASTDLSNSEQVRARALADRNQELEFLSTKRGCTK